MKMKAKKSLGQHFLKSEKALKQIIDSADLSIKDLVLEIGPGQGILTRQLLDSGARVVAIEKDQQLVVFLKEIFEKEIAEKRLEIKEGDILAFDPNLLYFYKKSSYKIVANIPYYITGAILEKFLTADHQPKSMVLLVQKEVAQRVVARDGKESILSLSVKAYGKPKIIDRVPKGAFVPAPKVDSAILLIDQINRDFFKNCDERLFFIILKNIFGKKRKQIRGSLTDFLENKIEALAILENLTIASNARPEDLSLDDWSRITQAISNTQASKKVYNVK